MFVSWLNWETFAGSGVSIFALSQLCYIFCGEPWYLYFSALTSNTILLVEQRCLKNSVLILICYIWKPFRVYKILFVQGNVWYLAKGRIYGAFAWYWECMELLSDCHAYADSIFSPSCASSQLPFSPPKKKKEKKCHTLETNVFLSIASRRQLHLFCF